ncbi:unnamed protein product [Durusdinium trenchii]|uniref:Pentatricopeptide repeat-containing protein n=1 Tax=Durusdinium trenchii TaxID=1381693 RepID=A0ABP0SYJ0_9DINO
MPARQLPWSLVSYSTFIEASPHWSTMCLALEQLQDQGLRLDGQGLAGAARLLSSASWHQVLDFLRFGEASGLSPDVQSYSVLMSCSAWQDATAVLMRMLQRRQMDRIACEVALSALGPRVEKVFQLLATMQKSSCEVGHRAVVSSCASAARWATAVELLRGRRA